MIEKPTVPRVHSFATPVEGPVIQPSSSAAEGQLAPNDSVCVPAARHSKSVFAIHPPTDLGGMRSDSTVVDFVGTLGHI